ncbi:RES domain-containing protein [Mycobacterium sp.]|uniref:RES domain-containing protein n=1 Tax=Mycobacterium sp. TaxID=1785 RepID=UPI003D112A14
MATNVYNGTAADLEPITKGSTLYRIRAAGATYAANSFNPRPKPLHDTAQGRFEPTDPVLGGYLYVAPTLLGAVAEGILRNQPIPASRLVPRLWLSNKMLAVLTLNEDIPAAAAYGSHAAKLNLDSSFLCRDSSAYSATRTAGTEILLNTPAARALAYPCRNCESKVALMLIARAATPAVSVQSEVEILKDPAAARLVVDTLDLGFGLKYAGRMP